MLIVLAQATRILTHAFRYISSVHIQKDTDKMHPHAHMIYVKQNVLTHKKQPRLQTLGLILVHFKCQPEEINQQLTTVDETKL